ncbi:hypothetical protein [Caldivirga sp. UBA161]|nr:hypothetical protein [Caldivirga sp. UBA161]
MLKVKEGLADKWGFNLLKTNALLHGAGRVFHAIYARRILAKDA